MRSMLQDLGSRVRIEQRGKWYVWGYWEHLERLKHVVIYCGKQSLTDTGSYYRRRIFPLGVTESLGVPQ